MARPRHPNKDIEKVLDYAESVGWMVEHRSGGHAWGRMRCSNQGAIIGFIAHLVFLRTTHEAYGVPSKNVHMTMSRKMNHEFTLIMDVRGEVTEELAETIYATFDDCTLSDCRGVVYLKFDREADSLETAISTAIQECCGIGLVVLRVDHCDLVSISEIARRCKLSKQAISNYANGKRNGGFPPPICHIHDDHAPLWSWCEVATWLAQNQLLSDDASKEAFLIEIINLNLSMRQRESQDPNLAKRIEEMLDCETCQ